MGPGRAGAVSQRGGPRRDRTPAARAPRAITRDRTRLGRVRGERFGPRTIDLDLLVYGDEVVEEPGLSVPHPRLQERRFALEPLAELDPGLTIPGLGPIFALLAKLE